MLFAGPRVAWEVGPLRPTGSAAQAALLRGARALGVGSAVRAERADAVARDAADEEPRVPPSDKRGMRIQKESEVSRHDRLPRCSVGDW